jgi:thiamine-phosphate pyrophosphorylase
LIQRISRGLSLSEVQRFISSSVHGFADVVQIREPQLGTLELLQLLNRVVAEAHAANLRVVVNDRVDVALVSGADGVHLRSDGPPIAAVRAIVPQGFLIGRSAHNEEEIDRAKGADYLIFGTVFPTASKPGVTGQGLEALRRAVARFDGPVLGIGGITPANAADVLATGAAGYAAIGAFDL